MGINLVIAVTDGALTSLESKGSRFDAEVRQANWCECSRWKSGGK